MLLPIRRNSLVSLNRTLSFILWEKLYWKISGGNAWSKPMIMIRPSGSIWRTQLAPKHNRKMRAGCTNPNNLTGPTGYNSVWDFHIGEHCILGSMDDVNILLDGVDINISQYEYVGNFCCRKFLQNLYPQNHVVWRAHSHLQLGCSSFLSVVKTCWKEI